MIDETLTLMRMRLGLGAVLPTPSTTASGAPWYRVRGGDGFYTAVDPTDHTVVYSESQNGNIRRLSLATGEQVSIRPRVPSENNPSSNIVPMPDQDTEIRWNWNTPFILSPHNPDVVYAGGNRLFRSMDRGETWTMSPDLTKNVDRDLVEIMGQSNCPAPLQPDGPRPGVHPLAQRRRERLERDRVADRVSAGAGAPVGGNRRRQHPGEPRRRRQLDRGGGSNIPGGTKSHYVSRVEASYFDAGTAYASVDGHKSDDLRPYVYVTRDYGASWESISSNLPEYGNVNTVRQDPRNRNLLYAGTEFEFFVSLDEGGSWHRFMTGLPVVRIDDVLVHPRDNDLVLATHGRSVMVMDDITPLQQLTPEVMEQDAFLFEPREAVAWKQNRMRSRSVTGDKVLRGDNALPGMAIHYYLADEMDAGDVSLTVTDLATGEVFRDLEATGHEGINRVQWDLEGNEPEDAPAGGGGGFGGPQAPVAEPGVYRVTLTVDGEEFTRMVTVLEDVWMGEGNIFSS